MEGRIFGNDAFGLVSAVVGLIHRAPHATSTGEVTRIAIKILARWRKLLKEQSGRDFQEQLKQSAFKAEGQSVPSLGQYLIEQLEETGEQSCNAPYRVYDRAMDVVETASDSGVETYQRLLGEVRPHVSGLRQKLLMTMKGKAQNRYVPSENGNNLNCKTASYILP